MEESVLITKVEKYLKNIQNDNISLEDIDNFKNFTNLYFKLDDRLNQLLEFKDKMDAQGYTAPFRSLNRYGTTTIGDESNEERMDNFRYNKTFRFKANAKKNILDRVKSAIDSHKIAIGNLEQYGYLKCDSCHNKYRITEYKENNYKCSCGVEIETLKINKSLVHRIEIIPYLPLSGNYMVLRGALSDWGKEAFNKILNGLKQERKGIVNTLSLKIRYRDKNNRWIHRNITLDSEFSDNYEEEVRRRYGKYVRIEQIGFYKTRPSIIDNHHARIALALAYVNYSQALVKEIKEPILKKQVSDYQRILKYDKIKYEYNHKTPKYIEEDDFDAIESWRQIKTKEEYEKLGFIDKNGKLNRSLSRDLRIKENIKKTIFANIAPTLIMWDIFKYYLTTSKNKRIKYISPFPYIRVELDRQQRKTFEIDYKKTINILTEETDIKIIPIKEKDLLLYEKFKLESENRYANLNLNYPALGAALIHLNTDLDIKTVGNIFNINKSKIKKEVDNINIIKGNDLEDENNTNKGNQLANQFRNLVLKK